MADELGKPTWSNDIAAVMYEWSHQNYEATSYSYRRCTKKDRSTHLHAIVLDDYELADNVDDDGPGMLVGSVMSWLDEAEDCSTECLDLFILKVAELTHRALAKLKATPGVRFFVTQHDRFPILAYHASHHGTAVPKRTSKATPTAKKKKPMPRKKRRYE